MFAAAAAAADLICRPMSGLFCQLMLSQLYTQGVCRPGACTAVHTGRSKVNSSTRRHKCKSSSTGPEEHVLLLGDHMHCSVPIAFCGEICTLPRCPAGAARAPGKNWKDTERYATHHVRPGFEANPQPRWFLSLSNDSQHLAALSAFTPLITFPNPMCINNCYITCYSNHSPSPGGHIGSKAVHVL
jgi:hypothetical protein